MSYAKTGMGIGCILLDAEVVYEGKNGELRLIAAEQYLPNYTVSSYYASLLQNECLSAEEREYFQGKLRAARWIIECVDRRRTMLLRCARIIMQVQSPFLKNGKQPLHLLAVQELSVYPPTVYRVMKGRYIARRYGIPCRIFWFIARFAKLRRGEWWEKSRLYIACGC